MSSEADVIIPIRSLKNAEAKEQDISRVLESVVPLDNGMYGYIYRDMGPYRSDRKYMCNVCKKVLIFVKGLLTHHVHPNHKINCKIPMHSSAKFSETTSKKPRNCPSPSDDEQDETENQPEEEPNITPGEPAPPGLEDVVDSVCQIQATFDSFTSGPLIGLEYIVELISIEQSDAEPRYICLLCEKKGDPRSVMVHVTSYNHYLKYICCFFRTVGNKLNLIPKSNNRSAINTAIIKVAEAIEKYYGRLKPVSTEMETFSTKKYQILREIDEKEHFRETPQTTFLELVTAAKMEEYAKCPVVNFNTKDMEAKNEELTKKCIEVNHKISVIRSLDKKGPDKAAESKVAVKSEEKKSDAPKKAMAKSDPLGAQNPPKKLCISLNKPERSIPGLSKPQVQNIDIVIKKENDGESDEQGEKENKATVEVHLDKDDGDDDVIIIPDVDKGPIEVESLSSVSSRSRSWSRPRNKGRSRSPHHPRSDTRRSRSRDQFGRMRRAGGSREPSYDRQRNRDVPSKDRDRKDYDDRGRREYDDRRRRDYDDRGRRGDSRGRRGDSRGRRGDSRGRRGDSRGRGNDRGRQGDSRDRREDRYGGDNRYRDDRGGRVGDNRDRRGDSRGRGDGSRNRYDDKRFSEDKRKTDDRDYGDRNRGEWARNPSPGRFRSDYSSRRDRYYESEERSQHISEEIKRKNRWNAYKEDLEKLEDDLEKTYKYYQGHPEKHPAYNDEWKAFWNRRYKEIQMSGQDPSKYDFKPEWILFWEKKMKEIHEQKVISEKETLKRKHNLDDLQDIRGDQDLQDVSPPTPETNKDVTVNDIKKTWKALTGSEITAPKRPGSPWESKDKSKENDSKDNEVGFTSQQFFAPKKTSGVAPVPPVIHSLRMLSVLEHQIGYQATRVIELLSQGLAMEKTKANHSMTMLQNKDIFLFFETMKEKLRGQLMAGIVQRHLVSATRNVIKTIEYMLEMNPLKPEVFEPVTIPGVGEVDKVAVAQKIAGALIKMGKINVSQEELEQLINAVVGMATASSVSADVSSDKFFSQLNIKNSNASSHINNILSTLIQTAQQSVSDDVPQSEPYGYEKANNDKIEEEDDNEMEVRNETEERGPSPFSMRIGGTNPIKDKYEDNKTDNMGYDDDDDDYSFEDVYHAASEKLKKSEEIKNPPSVVDENSQTQSSATSGAPMLKNVKEVLSSIDTSALSNLGLFTNQQSNKDTLNSNQTSDGSSLNDFSKSINLNDLKSILNQNQAPAEKSIDVSLVESIKDTLVQSFSASNKGGAGTSESFTHYSSGDNRPRERATMDPRKRGVWDPSIKALDPERDQWDDRNPGRPPVWENNVWDANSGERHWEGSGRQFDNRDRGVWQEQNNWNSPRGPGPWDNREGGYPHAWEQQGGARGPYNQMHFGPDVRPPPPFGRPGYPPHPGFPDQHFRHPHPPFY